MFSLFVSRLATFLHIERRPAFITGWKLYFFVMLILICETAALSFLKAFSESGNLWFLTGGFIGYTLVSTFLIRSYHYEGMGIVNVLWSAFSVLFVVLAGMIFFGEKVTIKEWSGTMMVIAGVVILRLPTKMKRKVRGGQCLHIAVSDVSSFS